MAWTSIVAIYLLFWTLSAFICLPFGVRTHEEANVPKVSGQADSAPANFRPWRVVIRATIVSAILCGLFVANYEAGWIDVSDIDLLSPLVAPEAD
jgi:predicted secreted protein